MNVRPTSFDFPLFLHVLGAMVLFGTALATAVVSTAGWRRPDAVPLRRAAFWGLLVVGIPSYIAMRGGAQWIYSKEGFSGDDDPTWVGIGFIIADAGLLILLATLGLAYWWRRSGKAGAARAVAVLSILYLLVLTVAMLAMSGKWG
jgi:uncharacterized membrane protein